MIKRLMFVVVMILVMAGMASAACTSAITTQAKQLMMQGYFQPGDTYKMAFYTNSASFAAASTAYTATNEVTGTNYSAGGYSLSGMVTTTSGTTAFWDFTDVSQSTVTFDVASTCAIVYDATNHSASCTASGAPWACCTGSGTGCTTGTLPIAFVLNFSSIQPSAGTLTVTWPTADATNAIVRIQ